MAYNNMNNRSSGGNNFARHDYSSQNRGDRPMFKTVCSECGKECEVPFRPSGDKPVFCSSCFEQKRGGSNTRNFDNRNISRPRFESNNTPAPQNNDQLNAINIKLDKILGLLTPAPLPVVKAVPVEKTLETKEVEIPIVKVEKKKKVTKKAAATPEA